MTGRTLAVCVAHPDDETYSTFGSVALHADDPHFRLVVLHATDGDAGQVAPGVDIGPEGLGAHRRREDEMGWAAVGYTPDRHDWLGYPDGELALAPFDEVVAQVARFLDEERPDVVCTFGPHGMTGHPDHITIGRATDTAFHVVRRDGGPGLRRLLHAGFAETYFRKHQAWLRDQGLPQWQPDRLYHLRGTPDEDIGVKVATRQVADRVFAGIQQHRSQMHVLFAHPVDDTVFIAGNSRETHVVAWPPRAVGAPVLTDIFEGLDDD